MVEILLESAIRIAAEKVKVVTVEQLTGIASLDSDISEMFSSIVLDLDSHLVSDELVPLDLAGQLQNLIQVPLRATTAVFDRLDAYSALSEAISLALPDDADTSTEAINKTLVVELSQISVLTSLALIVTTGPLRTRAQAVEAAEVLISVLGRVTNELDTRQEIFKTNNLDRRYFSQLKSYPTMLTMFANAIQYLMTAAFDLAVEKRIVLAKPTAPIDIVITEYGSLGEDDANFDEFIEANKLKNNDILLLPIGREVVVYV